MEASTFNPQILLGPRPELENGVPDQGTRFWRMKSPSYKFPQTILEKAVCGFFSNVPGSHYLWMLGSSVSLLQAPKLSRDESGLGRGSKAGRAGIEFLACDHEVVSKEAFLKSLKQWKNRNHIE